MRRKIITLLSLNFFIKKTKWFREKYHDTLKFHNQTRNLEIVNLGSNSGRYGFDYSEISLNAANWAGSRRTLAYDFQHLKNYHSLLKQGATVVLTLCPFSSIKERYDDPTVEDGYYLYLHQVCIEDYDSRRKRRLSRRFDYPLFDYMTYLVKGSFNRIFSSIVNRNRGKADFASDALYLKSSWMKEFDMEGWSSIISNKNRQVWVENQQLLLEMVRFCKERSYRPILVIPPVSHSLAQSLEPSLLQSYLYDFVAQVVACEKVLFLNYIDDIRLTEDRNFRNSYMLNEEGAKRFTQQLIQDIFLSLQP